MEEFKGCIGIDLGTTYSCVAVWQNDKVDIIPNDSGNRTTPSYVSFHESERLIGDAAKNNVSMNPTNTVFDAKRMIGREFNDKAIQDDLKHFPFKVVNNSGKPGIQVKYMDQLKTFTPEEISAMVLEKMKKTAEDFLGKKVKKAVVTVPAYFNEAQRQATKDAGTIAGLEILRIINEPTAAALAYGLNKNTEKEINILVFDFGGGTHDVSVLSIQDGVFEVKATNGDTRLGGEDLDNKLVEYCLVEFKKKFKADLTGNHKALRRLRTACERAKRQLSSATTASIDVDSLYEGNDFNLNITRAKFEQLCADYFKRTIEPVKQVLTDAKMDKTMIDEIVLVGGSTRIPKIQELLKEFFNGKELCKGVNPDEAIAYGAAVQGAILTGTNMNVVLVDVVPLSLGIETAGEIMTNMIDRNSTIPCKKQNTFSTASTNQPGATIRVFEGERKFTKDNRLLGQFDLTGIPPAPKGVPKITVTYDVDANGLLTVTAELEGVSDKKQSLKVKSDTGSLSKDQIEKMRQEAEKYKEEDEKALKRVEMRNKLDSTLYGVKDAINNPDIKTMTDEEKKDIKEKVEECENWLLDNKNATLEEYEAKYNEFNQWYSPYGTKMFGMPQGGDGNGNPSEVSQEDIQRMAEQMTKSGFGGMNANQQPSTPNFNDVDVD